MNEGQIELIQIISEVGETIEIISEKLEHTREIKDKAKDIKKLADAIIELAKHHEVNLKEEKSKLHLFEKRVSELHFKQLKSSRAAIAELIIANLPDYLEKPDVKDTEGKLCFQLIKKEAVKTRKHELDFDNIILGEVWVGTENISEEDGEKTFSVSVRMFKTEYTKEDSSNFTLKVPHRIYKTLDYIHVNTSYKN